MAINIQSGQTWAEIRAHLNDRALDKTGDVVSGVLNIKEYLEVDSIADNTGNIIIDNDNENNAIKIYDELIGGKIYSDEVISESFKCPQYKNTTHIIKIPISHHRKNGRLTISGYTGRDEGENIWNGYINAIFFSDKSKHFYVGGQARGASAAIAFYCSILDCYIEGNEILVYLNTNLEKNYNSYWQNISVLDWEVW